MNTLVIEIFAYLLAAAFFSLFIGWMIRSALAKKELKTTNSKWEAKQSELELRYKQDTEQLEEQVQSLGLESKQLASQNKSVSNSLRENEIGVHKARADAIELNRQQADTQERLQRIIAQKDEELKLLREGSAANADAASMAKAPTIDDGTEAKIATLSAKREQWELERQRLINNIGDDQATVAIDPADLPSEPFDRTVRINPEQVRNLQSHTSASQSSYDMESDQTMTLDDDQTIVLEDNKLNRSNRQSSFDRNSNGNGFPGDNDDN